MGLKKLSLFYYDTPEKLQEQYYTPYHQDPKHET